MFDLSKVSTWSVLVVDDEPDNVEVVAEALGFFGASVKTAKDGEVGLEIMRGFLPNIILLDLSMPKMNGWEMRTRIKEDAKNQHIIIIALSAHAMLGDRDRALAAGFDGYMTKPINVATFADDIQKSVQRTFLPNGNK